MDVGDGPGAAATAKSLAGWHWQVSLATVFRLAICLLIDG